MMFKLAECFFHSLHDSLCKTIVVGSLINLVIYLLLCYTKYMVFTVMWSCPNKLSYKWKEVIEFHCFERWHHKCRVRPYRLHWTKLLSVNNQLRKTSIRQNWDYMALYNIIKKRFYPFTIETIVFRIEV